MTMFSHQEFDQLIATYGYLAVTLGVGLESMGLAAYIAARTRMVSPGRGKPHALKTDAEGHRKVAVGGNELVEFLM